MFTASFIIALIALIALVAGLGLTSTRASATLGSRPMAYKNVPLKASTTYYNGAHVMTVGGYLLPLADTSGGLYAGRFFDADTTTSAAADGTFKGKVIPPSEDRFQEFAASGAGDTWNNVIVSAVNDSTVALRATNTNDVAVGRVVEVLSSTLVIVDTADRFDPPVPA